jgi:redox-sensitive bicupin YhaK (pirin superfamily)
MSQFLIIEPHDRDLGGGFFVRRVLPSALQPALGPWVFFDHFGPVTSKPGENHDVRPHPHIGLATVTYMFEGAMVHRDSTGAVQRIEPGAINLMTAGRGIVHSERSPDDLRGVAHVSHGLQLWLGLPAEQEEGDPHFQHMPASRLPAVDVDGAQVRVLAGTAFGSTSPVTVASPTLFVEMHLQPGGQLTIPAGSTERGLYSVDQPFEVGGQTVAPHKLVVLPFGLEPLLKTPTGAHMIMLGGEPLGKRFLYWNFVSSRKERVDQAAADWAAQRFPKVPGDDKEFIPLPARKLG